MKQDVCYVLNTLDAENVGKTLNMRTIIVSDVKNMTLEIACPTCGSTDIENLYGIYKCKACGEVFSIDQLVQREELEDKEVDEEDFEEGSEDEDDAWTEEEDDDEWEL